MGLKFCTVYILFLYISSSLAYGQSYGLGFAGQEVVQDKRTGLHLSPNGPLCFDGNFEISFDLSFIPGYADYFGYVFRMVDQNKRNIDLIYDKRFTENKHFKLIIGDKVSAIAFDININRLYKSWHNFKLKFDVERDEISLFADGKAYHQKISLKSNCYKILFGANNYKTFKVTDVPPMKIRKIQITEGGKISYDWPLNEWKGMQALETINGADAEVINPLWIKKQHHDWELLKALSVKGRVSVALNPDKEELYIVGEDSLLTYNVALRKLFYTGYLSGKQHLLSGNQSLYDTVNNRLLNFYIDQKLVSIYDFDHKSWDKNYTMPGVLTRYWHPNKFYSAQDNSLYMIGGYGEFRYRKEMHRYSFADKTWSPVSAKGDFMPRYLAAAAAVKNGAYILGGYGSTTGEQILNPKNTYELSFFDAGKQTFKKILEIIPKKEDFAFANSMVIDEKARSYYALTFPNHKYNSSLQLIKGSLDTADYKVAGNEIPYTFHDINSFADLYYCPGSKRFVAATLFYDEKSGQTLVKIYSLLGPPVGSLATLPILSFFDKGYYIALAVILFLIIAGLVYWHKKKKPVSVQPALNPQLPEVRPGVKQVREEIAENSKPAEKAAVRNIISLFGGLQLFDKDGNDITRYFTPLIKELFLVVLLYTIKWGRGISSEKLTEILWFDKSAENARNNRSVNIGRLKAILDKMDGCQISKETGYWKINIGEHMAVDYSQYLDIINNKKEIDKEELNKLTQIIQRGGFLANVEYDWLDNFKSEISNEIIDTYLNFAANIKISDDPEFLISLSNYIFYFDQVNEEAMVIKCKALVCLGKHSVAKATYESFKKEYKAIYGEEFYRTFQEALE